MPPAFCLCAKRAWNRACLCGQFALSNENGDASIAADKAAKGTGAGPEGTRRIDAGKIVALDP